MPVRTVYDHADGVARASIRPAREGSVRPNLALRGKLALTHFVTYSLDVVEAPEPIALTPEEKLLRAIFGDRAALPDDARVAEVGAVLAGGDEVFAHAQGSAGFYEADLGTVDQMTRETARLPAGVVMRIVATVSWPGPLTLGDRLAIGEEQLGVIDGFVDDGDPEPALYLANGGRVGRFELARVLPTAARSLYARSLGHYDTTTGDPTSGEPIRIDQLEWLVAANGRALVGDYAAYHLGDRILRTRTFEDLINLVPIRDGYAVCSPPQPDIGRITPVEPEPPSSSGDIFTFFEKPVDLQLERLRRVQLSAQCAGLAITRELHGLRIAIAPPHSKEWSHGAVTDLFSQRVFGPIHDYECECGKHKRMKDRGIVCDTCGVEVIASHARRERLGHIELASPVTPRRFPGTSWHILPVMPPDLRPAPRSALNRAYTRVIAGDLAAVEDVLDVVLGEVAILLAQPPKYSEYSARAIAVIGTRCRASSELLSEMALPVMYGACEAAGLTTTIKSAKKLIATNLPMRTAIVRMAMHDRVVLIGHRDPARGPAMIAVELEPCEDPIVELDPATAAKLGVVNGDLLTVHFPVSDAAQLAARSLAPGPTRPATGWIHDITRDGVDGLLVAARANALDRCEWPHAALFVGGYPYDGPPPPPLELGPAPEREQPMVDLDRTVDELELSVRTATILEKAKIRYLRDLVQRTEGEMLGLRNFGRNNLRELKEILAEMGLQFGMKV